MLTKVLENLFDPYERRARLVPMLIALAPVIGLMLLYTPGITNLGVKTGVATLVYGALGTVLAALARQAGKRIEPGLKREWGGWPSMMMFRHRDTHIDPFTKSNIHRAMVAVVASTYAPTPEQEAANPVECDHIFLAWSEHLRKSALNDQKRFSRVFKENMSYGFHRNLLGLKPFAIALIVASSVTTIFIAWKKYQVAQAAPVPELLCLVGYVLILAFWLLAVSSAAVKQASYDYAFRLLNDCVPDIPVKASTSRRRAAQSTSAKDDDSK